MVFTDFICRQLQKKVFQMTGTPLPVNNPNPRHPPADVMREDGVRYVSDISYESQYPNGYLDILYSPLPGKHPTVLHWHGGGFIFGDKVAGDPLAVKEQGNGGDGDGDSEGSGNGESTWLPEVARRGYNVVSVNYALAPEHRHPVQMMQANEAIAFLLANGERYGLDMERVFLAGGSAGAIITEIYGLAVVDPDYAARLGFRAALSPDRLCGLIIDEAPTDYRNYNDFRMDAMINTWIGTNNLKWCKNAETLDVPRFIGRRYPPCAIISCNLEHTILDASRTLIAVLDRIGGDYVHYYAPPEREKLEHGFMNRHASSPCAAEALKMTLSFMETHSGIPVWWDAGCRRK